MKRVKSFLKIGIFETSERVEETECSKVSILLGFKLQHNGLGIGNFNTFLIWTCTIRVESQGSRSFSKCKAGEISAMEISKSRSCRIFVGIAPEFRRLICPGLEFEIPSQRVQLHFGLEFLKIVGNQRIGEVPGVLKIDSTWEFEISSAIWIFWQWSLALAGNRDIETVIVTVTAPCAL